MALDRRRTSTRGIGQLRDGTNGGVSEISYAGATTIGRIHCTTCHHVRPDQRSARHWSYNPGQAPLRVAGGANDSVYIETSPGWEYDACRAVAGLPRCEPLRLLSQSPGGRDASTSPRRTTISTRWGPHGGAAGGHLQRQAELPALAGRRDGAGVSQHTTLLERLCRRLATCSRWLENGNTPDHTMKPKITLCKTCRIDLRRLRTSSIEGRRVAEVRRALRARDCSATPSSRTARVRRRISTSRPTSFADGQFQLDQPRSRLARRSGGRARSAQLLPHRARWGPRRPQSALHAAAALGIRSA